MKTPRPSPAARITWACWLLVSFFCSEQRLVLLGGKLTTPAVSVTLRGEFTSGLLDRAKLYTVVATDASDADCSSATLASLADERKTVVPFPEDALLRRDEMHLSITPGLTFLKLCWVETVEVDPSAPPLEMTQYLGFFPPPSPVQPLPVRESRCFAQPADAPCELTLLPQRLDAASNPTGMVGLSSCSCSGVSAFSVIRLDCVESCRHWTVFPQ